MTYHGLEYIENTSNAYIDTGIIPNADTEIECKILYNNSGFFLGCRYGFNNKEYSIIKETGDYARFSFGGKQQIYKIIPTNTRLSIIINTKQCIIQDEIFNFNSVLTSTDLPLYLFCCNQTGEDIQPSAYLKIYDFIVKEKGILVRNFVPAKRDDGVIGMYDLVGRKFYISPNGVAFTGGVKSKVFMASLFKSAMAERRAA